ncbi:uncharacterized protein LOC106129803 [Amyelois transitella]|uniref:uncharacterized protein LOC106129803 n=1 Tax=Amyelois transitella TaxID=680683 RepID=UPI00298F690E|nr:uncharacterized protein LOC106129803 [Amyelois transitella]
MGVRWIWVIAACALACAGAERGGSSLRGALEALQRRQRGRMHPPMEPLPQYDALYEFVPPQGYPDPDYNVDIEDLDEDPNTKYVIKLLEDNEKAPEAYEYKLIKKNNLHSDASSNKKESAFRERSHHQDNERLRDLFAGKDEIEEKKELQQKAENDKEYALLLGQLWSKYKYDKGNMESAPPGVVKLYKEKIVKKRFPDNWGPIAFKRKRSSDSDADRPISPDYDLVRKNDDTPESNYNTYELPEDDKDDLREEYAIAFQPLDDDNLSDLADDDQFTYDSMEKRFPITKRSSGSFNMNVPKKRFALNQNKRETSKTFRSSSGTDPKIIRDLSRVFGDTESVMIKNPVKRSSDIQETTLDVKPPMLIHPNTTHEHHNSSHLDEISQDHNTHVMHHPGMMGKDEDHNHHNHDHNESEKPIVLKKKSIDWSDYFGIDKRKKNSKAFVRDLTQDRLRKQYFDTFNKEVVYPLNSFRKHSNVKRNYVSPNEESEMEIDRAHAVVVRNDGKRDTSKDNDAKLDTIDKKLKTMEGLIVDEALHFTNVGDDLDSKEEQEMKEKLLSRLAAAYSLEKMRKALKEFKQSLQTHRTETVNSSPIPTDETKAKRVAVKKEKVDISSNEIPIFNKDEKYKTDDFEGEQGAGHYLNGKTEEQFSEGYMGGSGRHRTPVIAIGGPNGACPVLAKIVQRCRGVDSLAGDRGQLFLPLCSLHQICYLCGEAPPTTCDLVFLSEADTTCEGDMSCQRAARSALMALRELHDNLADELDGECEASPCLPATLKLNVGWQRALQR